MIPAHASVIAPAVLIAVHGSPCPAQTVSAMEEYRYVGILSALDSTFRSALDEDGAKAVFGDREAEFIGHYHAFYKEMDGYLASHGFRWPGNVRSFNKLYFSPDGRVVTFLYDIRNGLSPEEKARFEELATAFLKEYRFPMTASEPFRQCGPSVFMPRP